MAKYARKTSQRQYPDDYGARVPGCLPDILSPISIDQEGDKLVPRNDMAEIAPEFNRGGQLKDPLGLLYTISKDGTKNGD